MMWNFSLNAEPLQDETTWLHQRKTHDKLLDEGLRQQKLDKDKEEQEKPT